MTYETDILGDRSSLLPREPVTQILGTVKKFDLSMLRVEI